MSKPAIDGLSCHYRLGICLTLLVLQSGCASLPPVIAYANYALSSITYLSTSKGPSDLALSRVVEKDCSMLRALVLKPICKPVTETTYEPLVSKVKRFVDNRFDKDDVAAPPDIIITMNAVLDANIEAATQAQVTMRGP